MLWVGVVLPLAARRSPQDLYAGEHLPPSTGRNYEFLPPVYTLASYDAGDDGGKKLHPFPAGQCP